MQVPVRHDAIPSYRFRSGMNFIEAVQATVFGECGVVMHSLSTWSIPRKLIDNLD